MKRTLVSASLAAVALLGGIAGAQAAPVAAAGYSLTTFAPSLAGTSGADSVEVVGQNVYVGYSNGTPKDGSAGTSTIVEYSNTGVVLNSTTVAGHTDGLRYDPSTNRLWSMQNEDANMNLVLITPGSLTKSSVYVPSAAPHGGGYDDALFLNGKTFLTASNPGKNPNTDPALVSATLGAGVINVSGILNGNAAATPLTPSSPRTLNLQDPDSLSKTQDGKLVFTSQADGLLGFVTNPGAVSQAVSSLKLLNGVTVDDTVFAGLADKTLIFADKSTNIVYSLTGPFGYNIGISAAQDATLKGFIGLLNADGSYTQIVTGLANPGGEAFLPVPEPASLGLLGSGLLGLLGLRRNHRG